MNSLDFIYHNYAIIQQLRKGRSNLIFDKRPILPNSIGSVFAQTIHPESQNRPEESSANNDEFSYVDNVSYIPSKLRELLNISSAFSDVTINTGSMAKKLTKYLGSDALTLHNTIFSIRC